MLPLAGQVWVTRMRFGAESAFYRDDLEAEYLDRYSCHASGRRDGLWTELFGPCCVGLEDALAWATGAAEHVWLDEPYGRRREVTDAEVRRQVVKCLADEAQLHWAELPLRQWKTATRLTLGLRDVEEAVRHLGTRRDHPCVLEPRLSRDGDSALRMDAALLAPTLSLASEIAAHVLKQWACGTSGLRDEMGTSVGVDYVSVRSPDGLVNNDD